MLSRKIYEFLLLSQLVCLGSAAHFKGGSIRWVPLDRNATGSPVQIMITQTYTYTLSSVTCNVSLLLGTTIYGYNFHLWCTLNCGPASAGYIAPPVLGFCTGFNRGLNLAFVQRTDIVNVTANASFTISHAIPNTAIQGFYQTLILNNGTLDSSAQWNISSLIDVNRRPDTGIMNTPPVANIISPYGIPVNVSTRITIPTLDIDGDHVRCRWGNSSLECGDVCFPRTMPPSAVLTSDCVLTLTISSTSNAYCASIQIEDFLNSSTSLRPMSSVPVQFLIYAYQPKNCSIPTLTTSLKCYGAKVGVPLTFNYTVINHCGISSNISDIAVQSFTGVVRGPLVSVTPNRTVYTMAITYTPIASQVGQQILCAIALDNTNIPSEQLCINFIVDATTTPACPPLSTTILSTTTTTTSPTVSSTITTTTTTSPAALSTTTTTSITTPIATSTTVIISTITTTQTQTTTSSGNVAVSPTSSTSSDQKTAPTNWILIGSVIGALTLLAILFCFCAAYYFGWGPGARHRLVKKKHHKKIEAYRAVSVLSGSQSNKVAPEGKSSKTNVKIDNTTLSSMNASTGTNLNSPSTTIGSKSISSPVEENWNKTVEPMTISLKSTTASSITNLESNVDLLQETKSISSSRKKESVRVDCVSTSRVKKEVPRRNNPSHAFVTRVRKSVSFNK